MKHPWIRMVIFLMIVMLASSAAQAEVGETYILEFAYGEEAFDRHMNGSANEVEFQGNWYSFDESLNGNEFDHGLKLYGGNTHNVFDFEVPQNMYSVEDNGEPVRLGVLTIPVERKTTMYRFEGNRISGEFILTEENILTDTYVEEIFLPRDQQGNPVLVDLLYLFSSGYGTNMKYYATALYIKYEGYVARHKELTGEVKKTVMTDPTPEPTGEPTPESTPEPTAELTPEPTPEPTAEPTPEPTVEPTAEPTPEAAPESASQSTEMPHTEREEGVDGPAQDGFPAGDWYLCGALLQEEACDPSTFGIESGVFHLMADGSAAFEGNQEVNGSWSYDGQNVTVTVFMETGEMAIELIPTDSGKATMMWNVEGNLNLLFTQDREKAIKPPVYGEAVQGSVTLPGGLKFGMSVDEAVAVSGFYKYGTVDREFAMLKARGFDEMTYLGSQDVRINGQKVSCYAYFTKDGLKQMEYILDAQQGDGKKVGLYPAVKEAFDSMEEALQSKYGPPVSKEQSRHQFKANFYDFSWYVSGKKWERTALGNNDCLSTRIVKLDNGGTVYIDHFCDTYAWGQEKDWSGKTYTDQHVLTYTFYDFQVDTTENTMDIGL